MQHKKMLLHLILVVANYCQGSVYLNPKDYTLSYLPPRGQIVLTADSPYLALFLENSGAVPPPVPPTPRGTWALNTNKGGNGTGISYLSIDEDSLVTTISAMTVNADGSFATVGTAEIGTTNIPLQIARFVNLGTHDTTFNAAGTPGYLDLQGGTENTSYAIIKDGFGGYYVSGANATYNGYVAHIASNGTQDTAFGGAGHFYSPSVAAVIGLARQSGGTVVCASTATTGATLQVNLMTDAGIGTGTPYTDTSFTPVGCAIDSSDRTLIVGTKGGGATVTRILPNASLDTTFGVAGYVALTAGFQPAAIAVDPSDNSMIIVGSDSSTPTKIQAVKVASAGVLDPSFGTDGSVIVPNLIGTAGYTDTATAVVVIPEGFGIAGQAFDGTQIYFATVLLTPTGSLNSSFSIPGETTIVGAGAAVVSPGETDEDCLATAIGYQTVTGSAGLVVTGRAFNQYGAVFYKDGQ